MTTQELPSYSQGQLTFIDTDDYGGDTQGLDYAYQYTPLSQTQTQTQTSQLTQNEIQITKSTCKLMTLKV